MKKVIILFSAMLVCVASNTGCGSSESGNQAVSAQDTVVYMNGLGCELLVYGKSDSAFSYKLTNRCQEGACSGLEDMEGDAHNTDIIEPGADAIFSEPETIVFRVLEQGNTIIVEPDPMYVGYDCIGSYDGTFQRKK